MDRRARNAGRLFAGVFVVGLALAILAAPSSVERVIRFYGAGLPWSMISFGTLDFPPPFPFWLLAAPCAALNGVIAYALGVYLFEPRAPKSSGRAI